MLQLSFHRIFWILNISRYIDLLQPYNVELSKHLQFEANSRPEIGLSTIFPEKLLMCMSIFHQLVKRGIALALSHSHL